MNQRTHAWMAIRAVALLEDSGEVPNLVKILKPFVKTTTIGAWIPDLRDSKIGTGDIDNHILKMKPYTGNQPQRFILKKDDLVKKLGPHREIGKFLENDTKLKDSWWNKPYKADPQPGQHIPNRSMALSTTLIDQLILGDPKVAALVPGEIRFASKLNPNARSRKEEVATYFFMMSHFVADACMPCHMDARKLSGYSKGLHKELETHWSKLVGTYFDKKKLFVSNATANTILNKAREIDQKFNVTLPNQIADLKNGDIWLELMMVCRASFALICTMAHPDDYPYTSQKLAKYETLFNDVQGKAFLKEIDMIIIHDAILNIAITWKHVWKAFD